MTYTTDDMTFLTHNMIVRIHIDKRKTSYHDKNVSTPPAESESAGYVKVKLIACPLISCTNMLHIFYSVHQQNNVYMIDNII